jgi:monovalent cation/hydrogen antiporter
VVEIGTVVLLLGIVAALAFAARRVGVPYPIFLVIGGLAIGFVPGLPKLQLEPDLVLLLFLPPILFAAGYQTSPRELWRKRRLLTLLALGLVLLTTVVVAGVVIRLVPGMPLAAALALGAIVSPPDAIAATSIAERLGLPRRLVTVIEGESLLNDATALVAYRFAVVAAVTGTFTPSDAVVSFVGVAIGGVLIGLVVGSIVNFLFEHLHDAPVEVLVSLLAPFAAYLPAEALGVSGVLAAVATGVWHGWRAPRVIRSETRTLLGTGAWETMLFAVNGFVFLLIGLQLPGVLDGISGRPAGELLLLGGAIAGTVVVIRLAWVFLVMWLPARIRRRGRREPAIPTGELAILGWTGMRGAVSLAAALALPIVPPFPERDLIVFLAFVTILVTLVGQGLTLPLLIQRLGLGADRSRERDELAARNAATEAAVRRLEELVTEIPGHLPLIDQLREQYRHRTEHYDRAGATDGAEVDEEQRDHELIRRAVLAAERLAVIELRERGAISDQALRRLERDIDLEELRGDA